MPHPRQGSRPSGSGQEAGGGSGRVPPQNLEAERSLLGAMLLSRDAIGMAIEAVRTEDFYRPLHGRIFQAVLDLYGRGEPVDAVTLAEALRQEGVLEELGGLSYLRALTADVPATSNAGYYADIVANTAVLRRLIETSTEIAELAYDPGADPREVLDTAEAQVFEIGSERARGESLIPLSSLLDDQLDLLEELHSQGTGVTGLETGFRDFDRLTAGLQASNVVIVAARPGMGKSTFIANVAQHVALRQEKAVAYFTLEMSKMEVVSRLLCAQARVEASKMKTGRLSDNDWTQLAQAVGQLSDAPLFIDDSGHLTVLDVRAKCRRLASRHPLGLIVVDYLQLMHGSGRAESRQVEISEISRGLKVLARELDVPVMAASQLNRSPEARADKRPLLGDLRESGSLEQDSDIVAFLYRDDYYNADSPARGEAELIVAKHRNGPTDTIRLAFLEHNSRFDNLTYREVDDFT
ncbi:MAG: replicative DNA helicase [Acidimicrobiia bacterium]|nr:replicative DNA helicase [Acidimicrobiia bacterium]